MNLGRYVFAQVVVFVPRYLFNKIVSKYKGDFHAKELNSYGQLLHLLFGQLTGCSSLHEICLCLLAHSDILYHLGIRKTVRISSLARANEKRDYHIFEELGLNLIQSVRPLYAKTAITDVCVDNVLYALDSTTISTSIKLAAWALGKYSKGAVKMHALLDLRGSILRKSTSLTGNGTTVTCWNSSLTSRELFTQRTKPTLISSRCGE